MNRFVVKNPNERIFSDIMLTSVESLSIIGEIIHLLRATKDSEESSKVLIPEVQNCDDFSPELKKDFERTIRTLYDGFMNDGGMDV